MSSLVGCLDDIGLGKMKQDYQRAKMTSVMKIRIRTYRARGMRAIATATVTVAVMRREVTQNRTRIAIQTFSQVLRKKRTNL